MGQAEPGYGGASAGRRGERLRECQRRNRSRPDEAEAGQKVDGRHGGPGRALRGAGRCRPDLPAGWRQPTAPRRRARRSRPSRARGGLGPVGELPPPARPAPRGHAPGAVAVRLLTIASAAADGPDGTPTATTRISRRGSSTAATGRRGTPAGTRHPNSATCKSGTGLLLDMGETVNVSRVQLVLGTPVGVDVQVRVGDTIARGQLPVAASASDVGGTVQLRLEDCGQRPVRADLVHPAAARLAGQVPGQRLQRHRIRHQEDIIRRARPKSSSKLDAIRSYSITIQS